MMWRVFKQPKNRRLTIDLMSLIFGIGGLLGSNSIFLQLPLLVNSTPEGWRLPTDIMLITQLANIGPIIYGIYTKYTSRKRDHWLIYGLLCLETAAMFGVAFLGHKTSRIFGGTERSVAMLSFTFIVSLGACTASLLFVPYMKNYRDIYLVSYLVGDGLSGFILSILTLIQGVGGNPQCVNATDPNSETPFVPVYPEPNFSSSTFFVITGIILLLSSAAFIALTNVPADSPERVIVLPKSTKDDADVQSIDNAEQSPTKMTWRTYIYLQVMMAIVSGLGGSVLPSIQSYACLPYGNVAYHLAVTMSFMANTLAPCIGFFVKNPRVDVLNYVIGMIFVLTTFAFYLASMSPSPPLQHTLIGVFLLIIGWVSLAGLIAFVRLTIIILFRADQGTGLFHAGISTQIGSATGAVIIYYLVYFSGTFVTYSSCAQLSA